MSERTDAILATPPAVSAGLYVFGVPLADVAVTLNLVYVVILIWLKLPEVMKRLNKEN